VLMPDGSPAPGAYIELTPTGAGTMQRGEFVTRAGPDGYFELEPGMRFLPKTMLLTARTRDGSLLTTIAAPPQGTENMELRPAEPAWLRVPFAWSDGQPLKPEASWGQVYYGIDGDRPVRIELNNRVDGDTLVLGPLPAGLQLTVLLQYDDPRLGRHGLWRPDPEVLEPGQTLELPTFVAAVVSKPTLSGRVLDPDEQPVEGARVYLRPSGDYSFVRTDADGRFVVRAAFPADEYRFLAATEDGTLCRYETVSADRAQDVVLVLGKPMTLQGTVLDVNDRPCPDVQVVVRGSWGQLSWGHEAVLRTYGVAETDVLGRWRLDRLVPGMTYTATASDSVTGAFGERELGPYGPGEQGPFTVRLQPPRE